MMRNLLIITGVGFVLSLVGLGGAAALVGNDVRKHDWTWVVTDDGPGDSSFRFERGQAQPDISRTIEWAGGDSLSIDVPGEVSYVQGEQAGIRISGPKEVVDSIRFADGRLTMISDDRPERGYVRWSGSGIRVWSETEALRIVITAPAVNTFEMGDNGTLRVRGYDQPTLTVITQGEAGISVEGRADKATITVNGDGDVNLSRLLLAEATVNVPGRGDVRVGPTERADIDISGQGDVRLTRNPAQVNQTITGWGEVEID
ncbi:GIN domain-containing protein [Brevundimonas sp. GCM10030266]|uniref:GIN domain-containing protein n=1 Tax=Brevundimonas sp. GCM10030266 TaxID=3273386 RepID=UPI00360600C4